MRLILYQPDIPQNTGTMLRMAACLGIQVDIIDPAGFDLSERRLKRAGLDYLPHVTIRRHSSFAAFEEVRRQAGARLVLISRDGDLAYTDFTFASDDWLMVGRESAGVPQNVHQAADARLRIPLRPGLRSLNVALAAAMVLGEGLRQTEGFPAAESASDA